jgi:tetratricopeptide (TPR) repeat protein
MQPEQEKKSRFERCVALEKEGKLAEAVREYESLIADLGGAKEICVNLGAVHARMGNLEEAMRCFANSLNYGEDYLVNFNMGSVLYKQGQFQKAILYLRRARKMNPDFALAPLVMGLCYSRMNERHAACRCFDDVLKIWPENIVALTALAVMAFQSGEFQKAHEYVQKILELNPDSREIKKLHAKVLYQMGKYDQFADAIKEEKSLSDGYLNYEKFIQSIPIEIYTDKYGSIDQKIEYLREKAKDDPTASSLVSLSLCHLFNGDTDQAIDCLVEARRRTGTN